jgi:hypothetical protein
MPTMKQEIDELMSASSHSYYAGGVASKLHQYHQDGYTWEEATIMIQAEGGLQTITLILPQDVYDEETAIVIPKSENREHDSDIWVGTWVPDTDHHKAPKPSHFVIDKGFHGKEDQKGHITNLKAREIQFRLLDGSTLSGISEPKTGQCKL